MPLRLSRFTAMHAQLCTTVLPEALAAAMQDCKPTMSTVVRNELDAICVVALGSPAAQQARWPELYKGIIGSILR